MATPLLAVAVILILVGLFIEGLQLLTVLGIIVGVVALVLFVVDRGRRP